MGEEACTKANPCCFELRIGVLIVGIVGIVVGLIHLGLGCDWLAYIGSGNDVSYIIYILAHICLLLLGIVGLASGIVLTVGVVNKNARLVKLSFFGYIATLVLFVIFVILMVVWLIWVGGSHFIGTMVGYIIWGILFAAATVYALMVISAYWKQNN